MAYVGNVGEKINLVVTLDKELHFQSPFSYYGTITLYVFHDENDNVIAWKTSSVLVIRVDGKDYTPRRGDVLKVAATVKEHSLYKDTEQTLLIRPKFEFVSAPETYEERVARIQGEQLDSMKGLDGLYTMPYRQYKEHYADCETLYGSYNDKTGKVTVIIREGRLVPSGVRFRRFHWYVVESDNGTKTGYKAVCEENAIRRAEKDYPGETFVCTKIYS